MGLLDIEADRAHADVASYSEWGDPILGYAAKASRGGEATDKRDQPVLPRRVVEVPAQSVAI